MSILYKALEKAERERKATLKSVRTEKSPIVPLGAMQEKYADRSLYSAELNTTAAEEFRKLRTFILRISISKPMKSILVTSAVPGEGKSTVASNLAFMISRGVKEHALLVDCDLRNPHLNPLVEGNISGGLSDYLMGRLDLARLIVKTETPKLSVLPSGSKTPNSAELVGSEKMKDLLKTLRSQSPNRYIIMDSPPIMSTTEPIILSEMVDGVVIVVRAGKTSRETVQRALNSINKEKILGIVLNQIESKPSTYYSTYNYSHQSA